MSDDLKIVRERMTDRMRGSGIDKRTAEGLAEGTVRRTAEENNKAAHARHRSKQK